MVVRAVTSPCGKLASLRNRPFAHSNCPRSSGGNSETDGRRALPFGFGRTRGSRRLGRADRSAPHVASLPSSLPVRLSALAALCALRTNQTLSRTMRSDCAVAHRARNSSFSGVMKNAPRGSRTGARWLHGTYQCRICGSDVVRKMPFAIQWSAKLRSSSRICRSCANPASRTHSLA